MKEKAALWAKELDELYLAQDKDKVDAKSFQYVNRITLDRAKFKGKNRYTWYSQFYAFHITEMHSDFFLNENYENEFAELELSPLYMTYNYGANRMFAPEGIQTKMWPKEYHAKMNRLLKEEYPFLQIIQIGDSECEKIEGADIYLLGENLEVIKYVLKNAAFHLDCEGGLVHLASCIGTKCVVLFGPTPIWFL